MKKLLFSTLLALCAITYPPIHAQTTYPPVIKTLNAITYPPVVTPDETYPPIAR